ncbi:NAD-dependent succinate-semialdehyde dehydrogenase [Candidatus Woesearchaeota archaeon]|nr:NAD-dependent succinate-semialdehyde dehydrogenase [Candidatus Woesearchaeota archaeon]
MGFTTINPATEEAIASYEYMPRDKVVEAAKKAKESFSLWKKTSFAERGVLFRKLAAVLREHKERYAKLAVLEMGKPLKQALAEVEKCAWTCEVYADNAEQWLAEEAVQADGKMHKVVCEPLGVIFSIMPWNFPYWQVFRFGIPTVIAGNVSILKHSNVVPQCAMACEEAFRLAGFPEGVFTTVITDHTSAAGLIKSSLVAGISLTGSTEAGARVAALAGKSLKKCVLELGGSDPFIVLDDADVDAAAKNAAVGRTMNNGQSCIAAKRFIVEKKIAGSFIEKFTAYVKALKVGDPMEMTTDVGPLVNEEGVKRMEAFVADAVSKGASVLCGGKRKEGKGFFFEPTVLADVKPTMDVMKEEVFGPVAPVFAASSDEKIAAAANKTEFGLGACIWTGDEGRGLRLAKEIEAGGVFINSTVKSDPRMPFGGVKKSGIGRELSKYGLKEFVNIKGINAYSVNK